MGRDAQVRRGSLSSRDRFLRALAHRPVDRVPLFLPLTMHGAVELGVPVGQYLQSAALVAEGQLRLRAKYGDDVVYPFFYGAIEHEAFGGQVQFVEDGPPTAVGPLWSDWSDIESFVPPAVHDSPPLVRVLEAIQLISSQLRGQAPILGVVMAPFSLPVMQLGFEGYLELLEDDPGLAVLLLKRNRAFAVEWANAQLAAGADAIVYFDPVSSPTVVPAALFHDVGLPLMRSTTSSIIGPCVAALASARSLDIVDDVCTTSIALLAANGEESLSALRARAAGRVAVMGDLNGIQMRNWTPDQAREAVRDTIEAAGPGGGFILSDSCGEIPLQVPDDVLFAIRDAVDEYGPAADWRASA